MDQQRFVKKRVMMFFGFFLFMAGLFFGSVNQEQAKYDHDVGRSVGINYRAIENTFRVPKREAVNIQNGRNRSVSLRNAERVRIRPAVLALLFLLGLANWKNYLKVRFCRLEEFVRKRSNADRAFKRRGPPVSTA